MAKTERERIVDAGACILYEACAEAFEPQHRDALWRAYLAMRRQADAPMKLVPQPKRKLNSIDARLERLRGREPQ